MRRGDGARERARGTAGGDEEGEFEIEGMCRDEGLMLRQGVWCTCVGRKERRYEESMSDTK